VTDKPAYNAAILFENVKSFVTHAQHFMILTSEEYFIFVIKLDCNKELNLNTRKC